MPRVAHARRLRQEMTPAERRLWSRLRGSQTGHKFRRQMPIDRFVADFASVAAKLVIEIDGDSHAFDLAHDRNRTAVLESSGYLVMRFWNVDVLTNIDGVLAEIEATLSLRATESR